MVVQAEQVLLELEMEEAMAVGVQEQLVLVIMVEFTKQVVLQNQWVAVLEGMEEQSQMGMVVLELLMVEVVEVLTDLVQVHVKVVLALQAL
jgi:hypothetical protein